MALIFTTWLWGDGYGEHYVRRLALAVKRNTSESRFIAFVDRPRSNLPMEVEQFPIWDISLTKVKGCFARLRLFDIALQNLMEVREGDRLVNLDLDLVVTGNLDDLFNRDDGFAILQNINSTNPCPYNGSVWTFRAGYRPDVWSDFSLDNYRQLGVPFHAFPDDQGWFQYKMPDAGAFGPHNGVYGFRKRGWPFNDRNKTALPENAKIVAFPGWRDPSKFEDLAWVREHWRD